MNVTKIEQQKNKNRVNVYLDNSFACGLDLQVALKNKLAVGKKVNEQELKEIALESEKTEALNKAANYLAKAIKTTKQIKDYLIKKEYNFFTIDYVVKKLKEYNYINDEQYAVNYISAYKNKYGKNKLVFELTKKGISKEVVNQKLLELNVAFDEGAINHAKKYLKNKEINYKNIGKLNNHLLSKGYSYDDINKAVSLFKSNIKGENDVSWD